MEYRLYAFCLPHLSSIQQGIQTGHAAVDLIRKYDLYRIPDSSDLRSKEERIDLYNTVIDWADNHKTFIILNGGDSDNLRSIGLLFQEREFNFPYVFFNESHSSLCGITTCVAAVLPASIFNTAERSLSSTLPPTEKVFEYHTYDPADPIISYYPSHPHHRLIELLKSSHLAR